MPGQTVQEQVIARTVKDRDFRERLLADPRAVLASEYNVHLPETTKVCVIEDAPDTVSIVLPALEGTAQELTDDELEAAVGGQVSTLPTFSLICTLICSIACDG